MNFNIDLGQDKSSKAEEPTKEDLQVICSGILRKDVEKIVYVRYERGKAYA